MASAPNPVDVKLTRNFKHNLATIESFYTDIDAPRGFEIVIEELLDTAIPNLERFPQIGRPFLARNSRSVEATAALTATQSKEQQP